MTADPRKRWAVLGTLLAATLAAVVFVGEDDGTEQGEAAAPRERRVATAKAPSSTEATVAADTPLALPETPKGSRAATTENEQAEARAPFRVATWAITPPPPPPAKPTAPPLPFKYLGKLVDDNRPTVFLSDKNNYLIAREGDRIDSWRIEKIEAKRMAFLYEPLKQRQELAIGE